MHYEIPVCRILAVCFAIVFIEISVAWLLSVTPVYAGSGCPAAPVQVSRNDGFIAGTFQLTNAIPEINGLKKPQGVFYQAKVKIKLADNQRVILSASPDVQGALCTDDQVEILVQPTGRSWRHDFRSSSRAKIEPIPPIDLTNLFQPGENIVTIRLTDLMAPAYSSSPYYLVVVGAPASPKPTAILATPTWTALAPWTPIATTMATSIVIPTPTATWMPPPSGTPGPPTPPRREVVQPAPPSRPMTMLRWLWAVVGFGLLIGCAGLWWIWRRPLRPRGELEIYQSGRFVTRVNLDSFGKSVITLGGRGDVLLSGDYLPAMLARIYAGRSDDGQLDTLMELISATDGAVIETRLLRHDDEIVFHELGYLVRYINFANDATTFLEGEQYA